MNYNFHFFKLIAKLKSHYSASKTFIKIELYLILAFSNL